MIVPGYEVSDEIGRDSLFVLNRGIRKCDGALVLLKTPHDRDPNGFAAQRLRREFEVGRHLDTAAVARSLDLVDTRETTALVITDHGTRPLAGLLNRGPLPLLSAIRVASALAGALADLHRQGFTHLRVQPSNILVDTTHGIVQLIGLDLVSRAPRCRHGDIGQIMIEGELRYISPEQTGRTARLVDYRTDFYSLGVVLYEMVTGRPPFTSDDPLEIIHAHVAKAPLRPSALMPSIPGTVSDIIWKLLKKPAENRYQSGQGLQKDLNRCFLGLHSSGQVPAFPLGKDDVPDRFELPQRLYGRESEIEVITKALDAVDQGEGQVLLISGPAGVGKTTLVQRLRRLVMMRNGYFISGKWGEVERATPYSGILQALRDFVRQILTEEEERLEELRHLVVDSIGANVGVLVDVVREARAIIGEVPPVVELPPAEARNRLHRTLQRFVQVIAGTRPLVVFYDDMQWIDRSSVEFTLGALGQKLGKLLLVCCYRDDALEEGHALSEMLAAIRDRGFPVAKLRLGSLGIDGVQRLVADALRTNAEHIKPLADLVYRRTAGNPYFVKALLVALHEEGALSFQPKTGWTWEPLRIQTLEASESALEITARSIDRLPNETRRVVTLAAALGQWFDAALLAAICGLSTEETEKHLIYLCEERILLRHEGGYQFEHDQVQEQAYALISEGARPAAHLLIGRKLGKLVGDAAASDRIFEIVGHLNRAESALQDPDERRETALLNLAAGRRAKIGTAFPAAYQYFLAGISLLEPDAWQSQYLLALALHNEAAESAFLTTDFAAVGRLTDLVHDRAHDVLDKISVFETQISTAYSMRQEAEGLRLCTKVLRSLGIRIPDEPTINEAMVAAQQAQRTARAALASSDAHMEPMTDPYKLAAMRLLSRASPSAGWTNSRLSMVLTSKLMDLTVQFGYSPESCLGFVITGGILCSLLEDYETGHEVGMFGLRLSERPDASRWRPICTQMFFSTVAPWKEHASSIADEMATGHRLALEAGDLITAGTAAFVSCSAALAAGTELGELEERIRRYYLGSARHGTERTSDGLLLLHQTVTTLLGRPQLSEQLAEGSSAMGEARRRWLEGADHTVEQFTCFLEMMTHLLFREHDQALKAAERSESLPMGSAKGLLPSDFYASLCLLGQTRMLEKEELDRRLATVEVNLRKMRHSADSAPGNYLHRVALVEAERARVLGDTAAAAAWYDTAVAGASESGYLPEEILACELAAEFYLSLGASNVATMYLKQTASGCRRWGARTKLDQFAGRLNDYSCAPSSPLALAPPAASAIGVTPTGLDATSVERAAIALASELDLNQLVRKMMNILMQNAGAQRGALLREANGKIFVEAFGSVDDEDISVPRYVTLETYVDISRAVVRYVNRTNEALVLGDAHADSRFHGDPYVESVKPKSILCTPILHQGRPVAILYLENNLIRDAFVDDRIAVVALISAQAAAALENARLHDQLKQEVTVRSQAEEGLRRALGEVAVLKDRLHAENVYLREEIQSTHDFAEIVGQSPLLLRALQKADLVASTAAAVLILGETGTGKELVARAVHNRSPRRDHPLVKLNCAAIPATLIESELFGHEKGAFTGALSRKIGRFELADGGTIFLDEIGDLPLELQAKLLRVLQEGEFERLGSVQTQKVNVRVIAATNRDLEAEIAMGRFRSDLYYRISVFPILLPPLRERREDIPILSSHLITKKQLPGRPTVTTVSQRAMDALKAYDWPGNVRELENVIERAMILCPGPVLVIDDSFGTLSTGKPAPSAPQGARSMEDVERAHILRVLEECGWKIKGEGNAAEQLALHPNTLQSRMKKLGIRRP